MASPGHRLCLAFALSSLPAQGLVPTPAAVAAPAPPSADEPAPVVLVSGVRQVDGSLPMTALGLGDGGLHGNGQALPTVPGDVVTPGGIRLRARAEGVKLDFPSGAELLVTPSLRLCLRDGAQSLPVLGRLVLAFADGSRLELEPDAGGRRPLRRATLIEAGRRRVFWPPQQAVVVEAGLRRADQGAIAGAYLVLGDGRGVYRAVPFGPLLGLRAVLLPRAEALWPATRLVLAGDVLAASLQRLPAHVPPHPVQFPQAPEAAQRLADLARVLFASGRIERPARARGPLVLALPQEWRLRLETGDTPGFLTFGLFRADAAVPAVEWTVNRARTELHLVRPFGGENGSPRYFLRGLDLSAEVRDLWPATATADDLRWLEQTLVHLGARAVRDTLPMRATAR